jgi:short-subunit dehydrogenase
VRELRGRNALVTGAAGGLGGYISNALAAEGVNLVLSDLPEASLDGLVAELTAKGVDVETVSADLTDRAEAEGLVAKAEEALGPLDILVNNAGVEFAGPLIDKTPAELEMLVDVNVKAVMLTTHAALPGMLERGRGYVVNIASMAGKASFPNLAAYCGSKHAVVGFTHALRQENSKGGVGFTAICPGFISKVGMYGRFEGDVGEVPALVRPMPPERVGEAVVKGIRDNRPEVIVNRAGARPLIFLASLMPGLAGRLGQGRQLSEFAERFTKARERAEPTHAERRVAERD